MRIQEYDAPTDLRNDSCSRREVLCEVGVVNIFASDKTDGFERIFVDIHRVRRVCARLESLSGLCCHGWRGGAIQRFSLPTPGSGMLLALST